MAKGSSFERSICRQLSEWWTNEESDAVFWRTSNSGGRATVRSKKGLKTKNHCGDIMAVDPIGEPFLKLCTLELKRGYNRFSIADLLDKPAKGAKQVYEKWIEQAIESHKQAGSFSWMLIVKRDHREALLFMPGYLHEKLRFESCYMEMPKGTVGLGEDRICCFKLNTWLNGASPKTITRIMENGNEENHQGPDSLSEKAR